MPISLSPQMMRQIIMDHYDNPLFKHEPKDDSYESFHSHSDNCIDDIMVYAKIENDVVVDVCWTGVACTISTASTDIMCGLMMGKKAAEAHYIYDQYIKMIHEEEFDESVLDEAIVFVNTSKQAARIRCATIGWDALKDLLEEEHKHGK